MIRHFGSYLRCALAARADCGLTSGPSWPILLTASVGKGEIARVELDVAQHTPVRNQETETRPCVVGGPWV